MQVAVTIALAVFYVGISLALGGVRPVSGMPWWFLVPCIVTSCAGFIAVRISGALPVPWMKGLRYGSPPRRVHLSWRAAVRLPAWAPLLLLPWHLFSILRVHFDLSRILYLVVALAPATLALVARKRWRQVRLLRDGEVAIGIVRDRNITEEYADQILYDFRAADGRTVSGRVWEGGYGAPEGSVVPVFYDAGNPGNHVVASACWFEAD